MCSVFLGVVAPIICSEILFVLIRLLEAKACHNDSSTWLPSILAAILLTLRVTSLDLVTLKGIS